jgi:hypothetical protein
MKVCSRCKDKKSFSAFYKQAKRYSSECRDCAKERKRLQRAKERLEMLNAYGAKCVCCFLDRVEFLAIDHVNNNGAEHRKEVPASAMYKFLKSLDWPKDDYQILCHNCNTAKWIYGQCPHQSEKLPTN